jgi:hypothetical protein
MEALETLKRWRAMDYCLAQGGLHVPDFAARWGVSQRTVHRDLAVFRAAGKRIEHFREPSLCCKQGGRRVVQPRRQVLTLWGYADRVRPLFVSSLRPVHQPPEPEPGPPVEIEYE